MARSRLWLMFAPYARLLGPAWLRRILAGYVPDPHFRLIKKIVDTMDASSRNIYEVKKSALSAGDEALQEQIGHGRDIMSILRKCFFRTTPCVQSDWKSI